MSSMSLPQLVSLAKSVASAQGSGRGAAYLLGTDRAVSGGPLDATLAYFPNALTTTVAPGKMNVTKDLVAWQRLPQGPWLHSSFQVLGILEMLNAQLTLHYYT